MGQQTWSGSRETEMNWGKTVTDTGKIECAVMKHSKQLLKAFENAGLGE